jgi:hypothetical protein
VGQVGTLSWARRWATLTHARPFCSLAGGKVTFHLWKDISRSHDYRARTSVAVIAAHTSPVLVFYLRHVAINGLPTGNDHWCRRKICFRLLQPHTEPDSRARAVCARNSARAQPRNSFFDGNSAGRSDHSMVVVEDNSCHRSSLPIVSVSVIIIIYNMWYAYVTDHIVHYRIK